MISLCFSLYCSVTLIFIFQLCCTTIVLISAFLMLTTFGVRVLCSAAFNVTYLLSISFDTSIVLNLPAIFIFPFSLPLTSIFTHIISCLLFFHYFIQESDYIILTLSNVIMCFLRINSKTSHNNLLHWLRHIFQSKLLLDVSKCMTSFQNCLSLAKLDEPQICILTTIHNFHHQL